MFARQSTLNPLFILGISPLLAVACDMNAVDAPPSGEFPQQTAEVDPDTENPHHDVALRGPLGARVATSKGYYSIPYEAGTNVRVSRDHLSHTPKTRIDMYGVSGGPYKVVAAASGTVRFIEDSNSVNGGCANNNYVWIEHANGEWTKYSHIAQDTATMDAGLSAGDSIRAGQFLGIESDVGCASGDHVHFEVAKPDDPKDPINPVGGYIKGKNLIPRVCGIAGNKFVAGTTYKVPGVRPGFAEYARHGLADNKFQEVFDAASRCGYRMAWNDGFEKNGKATFNVVFHQNKSPSLSWKSHRRLTKAQLGQRKAAYEAQGYSIVLIDTYNVGSKVRYAALFQKGPGVPATATYHGLSAAAHQATFNAWKGVGWKPLAVSVASVNGTRTYSGVYTQASIGSYILKSTQTSAQYQSAYSANKQAGRRLIYLNSYVHNGSPRYTAIWASSAAPKVFAKHGLTSGGYQSRWQSQLNAGYLTGAVTGLEVNGKTRYAAFWEK